MTTSAQPVGKRPTGRPAHKSTAALRDKVEVCVAGGMTHAAIAVVVGVSMPTLEKHYAVQLENGASRKRAEWLMALHKAAKKGNASAIRQLWALNPNAEGIPLPPENPGATPGATVPAAGDKAAKPAPVGKKEEVQANAEAAVTDASNGWGRLLTKPPGSTLQ